jgi:uncharacterized protein (UPF0335 family)
MRQTKKTPVEQRESFFEESYRLKQEAKQLAKEFKDIKPTKYLLK